MTSVHFQGKPLSIMVNLTLCPNHSCKEAEVNCFYEGLQHLLELIPKKDVLFIIGDWNAKVGGQDTLEITGKFGLGGASLVAQLVKNPPAMQETLVQFLGREDPLEKG